ncbi:hypothetical protein AB3U99_03740 [Niallia sp. JL1B1071]|uniref:hypothetical protein n=1 Tax=Niallia tiangongensis TaxID=3237105 RepID=UPI0037DCA971
MKSLIINEILLLSKMERKAKRVQFHPKTTIIKGTNHTGKSSLLKSIYTTFGATPKIVHPKWQNADVITVVKFSVENQDYTILRKDKFYAVFNHETKSIETFNSVTKGLGPYLSTILGFKIKLNNKQGDLITPPPAYYFLPFYVDQDAGWKANWSSFDKLFHLKGTWKKDMANYHSGIKPNEYYETKAEIQKYNTVVSNLESEKKLTQNVSNKLIDQFTRVQLDIDMEAFKREIDELVMLYHSLREDGDALQGKIVELNNKKISIQSQISIIKNTMTELNMDYQFALNEDEVVSCPTCGSIYENSFAERFDLAKDEDRCQELLIEKELELKEIKEAIAIQYQSFNQNNTEVEKIKETLDKKQGEITLRDLIQNEGKKELRVLLDSDISRLNKDIVENTEKIDLLKENIKFYDDKERQKEIKTLYTNTMTDLLLKLDVLTMSQKSYKAIDSVIKETGSGLPRALLAYYYSFLKVVFKYSTATFCPIVIDSPNQQDQSPENLRKMINVILEKQPRNSQIILGVREMDTEVDFEGKIIELKTQYSLLQEDEYESVSMEINQLLEESLNLR